MRTLSEQSIKKLRKDGALIYNEQGKKVKPLMDKNKYPIKMVESANKDETIASLGFIKKALLSLVQVLHERLSGIYDQNKKITDILSSKEKRSWKFKVIRSKDGTIKEVIAENQRS